MVNFRKLLNSTEDIYCVVSTDHSVFSEYDEIDANHVFIGTKEECLMVSKVETYLWPEHFYILENDIIDYAKYLDTLFVANNITCDSFDEAFEKLISVTQDNVLQSMKYFKKEYSLYLKSRQSLEYYNKEYLKVIAAEEAEKEAERKFLEI